MIDRVSLLRLWLRRKIDPQSQQAYRYTAIGQENDNVENWNYYPTGILFDAMQTVVGWLAAIFAGMVLGIWLGAMLGLGQLISPLMPLYFLPLLPWIWLWNPSVLIAYAVTLTALWLALHCESISIKLVTLSMDIGVWVGVTSWIIDRELMHWVT